MSLESSGIQEIRPLIPLWNRSLKGSSSTEFITTWKDRIKMQLEGSRKIVFGFILVGIGIALDRYLPNGLTANMLELMKFVTVGFFLGNGVEHVTKCVASLQGVPSDPNTSIQMTYL